jgi:peptidoglycan/xylan/chitin deacetylase (PgdA/CDA1 family)
MLWGLFMDDRVTALRDRPGARLHGGAPSRSRRRIEAQHRRRRLVALAVVALVALILGASAGSSSGGGGAVHATAHAPVTGYFVRLHTLGGVGPGSFAGEEGAAENAAINRTLTRTPYVQVAGSQHREIALTFDDGPGPYTPQVLAVLQRENVPGTFFEVGVSDEYFHASTAAIAADGYPIGDHTENHYAMSHLSYGGQKSQLLQQTATIARYGAPFPRLFRPPYGLWDATTLNLLKHYHMLMVLWTVDTNDYTLPGVDTIVNRAVSGARPGAIILMHDAGGNRSETVAALPKIIAELRKRRYRFVTVPRLLLDNPAPSNQQAVTGAG